jgi:hypothetical protein
VTARHARYYDTRFQAVLAWLALQLVGAWCVLSRRRSVHARREPVVPWPTGADLAYAQWLHAENESPIVRPEVRA